MSGILSPNSLSILAISLKENPESKFIGDPDSVIIVKVYVPGSNPC